jgi:hypothetical protein
MSVALLMRVIAHAKTFEYTQFKIGDRTYWVDGSVTLKDGKLVRRPNMILERVFDDDQGAVLRFCAVLQ